MSFWGGLFTLPASAACPDSVCYTYDALGRLTQADYADGRLIEYTYDPAGNRVAVERTGVTNAAPMAVDDTVTGKRRQVRIRISGTLKNEIA
ncbi:MAG: RHS repeat protein [Alphaproteobacteria bacterium]|nr:RHS repeat protein [Alphaproteobacteria bacterium]